jgi:hypothetical protein
MTEQSGAPVTPPAAPANALEARARLDTLIADKDWGAKLLANDAATTREYRDLQDKAANTDDSTVSAALSGQIGEFPDSSLRLMANTADMLREKGFPEQAIRETISGKVPAQVDVDIATAWRTNLKSKDFTDRLLRGEPDAERQHLAANIILSNQGDRF